MGINKDLKVNSATLLTLFAPKGQKYTREQFRSYYDSVRQLFKLEDVAAVAEPCPKTPEDWHMP